MIIQNNEELPENIWNIYGLKRNPFTTDAILINEGYLPLDAFVGRANELKIIRTLFRMGDGTRVIVTGETGVGKTTLVNYARAEAIKNNKFFTHLREMSVDESWNVNEFIAHTLSNIYNTIERLNIKNFSQTIKKKLSYLFDIMELTEEGFSLNVLGSGVGYNSSKNITTPKITTELLKNLFNETINELNRIGFPQVVLHYNNLENLSKEKITKLFVGLRDFLQNEKVHFIFVGGEPLPSAIYDEDKVRSIFVYGLIELKTFTFDEIKEILDKRIKYLSLENVKVLKPYKDSVLIELNKIHKGNIRDILNSLCVAMVEILSNNPNEPIILDNHKLRLVLRDVLKKRYLSRMSPVEIDVLKIILKSGETTNTELSEQLKKLPQNISKNINKLRRLKAISEKRIGVEKILSVKPEIRWMDLENEEDFEKKVEERKGEIEKVIETNVQKLLTEFEK